MEEPATRQHPRARLCWPAANNAVTGHGATAAYLSAEYKFTSSYFVLPLVWYRQEHRGRTALRRREMRSGGRRRRSTVDG